MNDEILKAILAELKGIRSDMQQIKSHLNIATTKQPESTPELITEAKKPYKRLKKYRMDMGYTIYSLADIVGVHYSTISYWESGVKFPRQKKMMLLEDLFNATHRDLFTDLTEDEMKEVEARME